jgi:hypothetical protein
MFIQNVAANVIVINHSRPSKKLSNFFVISLKLYHIYDKVKSVMIKSENIFDDIEPLVAIWVEDSDTVELARIANMVIDDGVEYVSLPCAATQVFWPWIENSNVKILNRFDFVVQQNSDMDMVVSEFATAVNSGFRAGAFGAQVRVSWPDIQKFVGAILPIKNDLFFGRYLSIAIDIDDAATPDWDVVFANLARISPNSVLIMGHADKFNPRSDFVGRIYGMLEQWNINSDIHLMFGKNMLRVSQALRLVQKMRPELVKNMRVFLKK